RAQSPACCTRESRIFRSEPAVRGHAASAVSAASSRRPSRSSADAFSSAISYWSVAYPELNEFNAILARSENWLADLIILVGMELFKTKRCGVRGHALRDQSPGNLEAEMAAALSVNVCLLGHPQSTFFPP